MRKAKIRLGLAVATLGVAAATVRADEYELGQGYPIGDFLISGYLNAVVELPENGATTLTIDDASLFVAGRVNRWFNPFIEAEISSLTLMQSGNGPREQGHLVRERIYDDLKLSDIDTVRIGKILAPVGEWNLIHAAPLVPTTTQPLTTSRGFANYTSGASWLHETSDTQYPDWQLYVQPGNEWFVRPETVAPRRFRNVSGIHVNWALGLSDKLGLSAQHGELANTGETYTLIGANFHRTFGRLVIDSEATGASWSGGNARRAHDFEGGIYVLGDYALTKQWHGIAEAEYFQDHLRADSSRNLLFGVAFKPRNAVVCKFEYVDQMGSEPSITSGWKASLAVLF